MTTTTTTGLLDLNALPTALRASLAASLDNDESRRRAVLAPWAEAGYAVIYPDRLHAWRGGFWRAGAVRRESGSVMRGFFGLRRRFFDALSESIFDARLPFFATTLTPASTRSSRARFANGSATPSSGRSRFSATMVTSTRRGERSKPVPRHSKPRLRMRRRVGAKANAAKPCAA